MSIEDIKVKLEVLVQAFDRETKSLHKRITALDAKVDPAVRAVEKSKLTPIWVVLLAATCFAAGIWLRGMF